MKRLWIFLPILFSYSCEYYFHMWEWEKGVGLGHDWWFWAKQLFALIAFIGFFCWFFYSITNNSSGYHGPDDGDVDDF